MGLFARLFRTEAAPELPRVIPAGETADLPTWLDGRRSEIDALLNRHGAIRFTGFAPMSAESFERAMRAAFGEVFLDNGEHDRKSLSGGVATPVFYPATEKILWHSENSFNFRWPTRIAFACVVPAERGGETPIVDTRRMARRLNGRLRRRLLDKKILYARSYHPGLGRGWRQTLNVQSRAEAERYCRENRIDFAWDGEILRTRSVREALLQHPETGDVCWFAQPTHWHPRFLAPETRSVLLSTFGAEGLPRDCRYGDGSSIEDSALDEIAGLYQELEVAAPWRAGDVMLLDNIAIAHARNPFGGRRELMVCMGAMSDFSQTRAPRR